MSKPPKILLSLSSSFFNLGSLGIFETATKPTLTKLRNSKFTNSAVRHSIFPSFYLQLSKTSSRTAAKVQFLSSRWILFFMCMFPLFKLNFLWLGRRGERCPRLSEGSAGGSAWRCRPGQCVGEAEPPEPGYQPYSFLYCEIFMLSITTSHASCKSN
jgi:hypothetical protein